MGQAAQRARTDPSFGRIPKEMKEKKRGLVVSVPLVVAENSVRVISTALDPQELRYSLLFWDELVRPQNNLIHIEPGAVEQFLMDEGILKMRSLRFVGNGEIAQSFAQMHIEAFKQLDGESPGTWSLATGPRSFNWDNLDGGNRDGFSLELLRAIPVPDVDVPLEEVLEFKARRHPELLALRAEVDSFSLSISKAENTESELHKKKEFIENACRELLSVGMEWKFPVRISDLKCSFELNPGTALAAMMGGYAAGTLLAMPALSAMITGAASILKITGDLKRQPVMPRSTPYQYVYNFHKEVF